MHKATRFLGFLSATAASVLSGCSSVPITVESLPLAPAPAAKDKDPEKPATYRPSFDVTLKVPIALLGRYAHFVSWAKQNEENPFQDYLRAFPFNQAEVDTALPVAQGYLTHSGSSAGVARATCLIWVAQLAEQKMAVISTEQLEIYKIEVGSIMADDPTAQDEIKTAFSEIAYKAAMADELRLLRAKNKKLIRELKEMR